MSFGLEANVLACIVIMFTLIIFFNINTSRSSTVERAVDIYFPENGPIKI